MSTNEIAISTSWNAERHESGASMVEELLDLGFNLLELSVHVTPEMLHEVAQMVEAGRVRIASLHNPCPSGPPLLLSTTDESERRAAVAQARETIDWAVRLGARFVVLHLGRVPMQTRQREAGAAIAKGCDARSIIMEELMNRAEKRGGYLDRATASLAEIAEHAEESGIRLGLENRYYYVEIPSIDEFQAIFRNVRSPALGYWHDTGHAHTMEVLGVAAHEDYLKKYASRLFGAHIHDAVGTSDHRAPGEGEIDFAKIVGYLPPEVQLVLEVHRATAEELVASREKIQELRDV
ncbi:MAG: sugar phosphate isomerase/epimerase family protein [Armatimonadota bacterium]